MNSELLLLRLEVLKRGVRDVQEVLQADAAASAAVKRTRESVGAAWDLVVGLLDVANNSWVIKALSQLPDGAGSDFKTELNMITRIFERVQKEGPDLQVALEVTREELLEENSRAVRFGSDFSKKVIDQTRQLSTEIGKLTQRISDGHDSSELWQMYFAKILPPATRLFVEYLDLLGGVSIRERSLAIKALADVYHLDELCALADWHFAYELTLCQDWGGPPFVALPGRDLLGDISAWPILRLGFATWSIWGLPLEGYEFGKLLVDEQMSSTAGKKQWASYIREFGEPGTRVLIADSIAAWAEGPAYACALLFLVLNPYRSQSGQPKKIIIDADRAEVVLAALNGQAESRAGRSSRRADGYGYLEFLDPLAGKWKDAGNSSGAVSPSDRVNLLRRLPGDVQQSLGLQKAFDLTDWRLSDLVLAYLDADQEVLGINVDPGVPGGRAVGIRHLTNAAWRGRLRPARNSEPETDRVQASPAELEQRAMKAGISLIKPRDTPQPGGGANSLKHSGR